MSAKPKQVAACIVSALAGAGGGAVAGRSTAPEELRVAPRERPDAAAVIARASESPPAATLVTPAARSGVAVTRDELDESRETPQHEAQLAELQLRIVELEAEIERLQRLVREGDPERKLLEEFFAANELASDDVRRALYELVVDAERYVADPTLVFPVLLRVVDHTGIAAAPLEGDSEGYRTRELRWGQEESENEDGIESGTALLLSCLDGQEVLDSGRGRTTTELQIDAQFTLPKSPAGWRGARESISLDTDFTRGSDGTFSIMIVVDRATRSDALVLSFDWDGEASSFERSPWHGETENRPMTPDEFPALRDAAERFFEQLETRAR